MFMKYLFKIKLLETKLVLQQYRIFPVNKITFQYNVRHVGYSNV
jgi:hypothetical protein